jgi:hypothetical protein
VTGKHADANGKRQAENEKILRTRKRRPRDVRGGQEEEELVESGTEATGVGKKSKE